MKKKLFQILLGILILSCSTAKNPNNLKFGVNELESVYSENFKKPINIEFIFSGNPKYVDYYFIDLEKKIKTQFLNDKLKISFRYLGLDEEYESKNKANNNEFLFYLNVSNSTVIDEKSGYDRLMKFDLNGMLVQKMNTNITFNFKSVVYAIHDINNKNEMVADYLFSKLYN